MGTKRQISLQERRTRHPVAWLRLVCICTHCPRTWGRAGFPQSCGAISAKEPAPRTPASDAAAGLDNVPCCSSEPPSSPHPLPAPHPSSSHLSSCQRGENALPSVRLQSLTHYFYFCCRQAIAKIPAHQHIHCCKVFCPQPPEKKQLIPSSPQFAIINLLQKDSKEEKSSQLVKVTLAINIHGIQAKN